MHDLYVPPPWYRDQMSLLCLALAALLLGGCAAIPETPLLRPQPQPQIPATFRKIGTEYPSLAPLMRRVTPAVVNVAVEAVVPIEDHPLLQDPDLLPEAGEFLPHRGDIRRIIGHRSYRGHCHQEEEKQVDERIGSLVTV